ncbi:MAG: hypothetical protein MJE63_13605, partial [Proteobacteria bacterium]|nr:hypothetical protein [Pseudomonadota bacterium]
KGQQDRYTFSLGSDTRVLFDSLSSRSDVRWTLQGPAGTLVNSRQLSGSDADHISGNTLLSLVAGDYTLTIDGTGGATGDYAFRLLTFDAATAIAYDVDQSGTMSPGDETRLFRFTGSKGDTLNFDWDQSLSNDDARWRLFGPHGELIFGPSWASGQDQDGVILQVDGEYTLAVEGPVYLTDDRPYGFTVRFVENIIIPPLEGVVFSLGDQIDGAIATAGEIDAYVFTIAQPAFVYMDMLPSVNNLHWTLTGPTGDLINNRRVQSSDAAELGGTNPVIALVAPGTYQVRFSGVNGTQTGAYSWRLLDLAAADAYTPGDTLSDTLTPGAATDIYRFNATAGDRVFVDVQSGYSNINWRLIDQYGVQRHVQFSLADAGPLTLEVTGDWYLLIEGREWDTAASRDYALNVVPLAADSVTPLALDATTSGSIAFPGERDRFTFTLTEAKRLYFDSLTNNSSLTWSLVNSAGDVIVSRNFTGSDGENLGGTNPVLALDAGTYELIVDANNDVTGDYLFRLLDLNEVAQDFVPGVDVVDMLDPAAGTSVYKFSAQAGDRFYFDFLSSSTSASIKSSRIIDPFGAQVRYDGNLRDGGPFDLAFDGEYLLLIEGRRDESPVDPSDISFNLQPVVDHAPVAITVGDRVDGQIEVPGETRAYRFSVQEAGLYYFDSLAAANNQSTWSLSGPTGSLVSGRDLYDSDAQELGGSNPLFALVTGDYVLTIDGNAANVPAYAFRVLNLTDAAETILPGTVVSGDLDPAQTTGVFAFDATAGDEFYFDLLALSNSTGNLALRVFDHAGRQVLYRSNVNDYGRFAVELDIWGHF